MSLSHVPDFVLIKKASELDSLDFFFVVPNDEYLEYDRELDQRQPPDHFYFGDCAGQPVFLPIEPVDDYGNVIASEVIGRDGEEIVYAI